MKIRNGMYRIVFTMITIPFLLFSLLVTNLYSSRLEKVITESLYVVASAQIAEMNNFCDQQRNYLSMIGAMDVCQAALRDRLDSNTLQYLNNMLYAQMQSERNLKSIALITTDYRVAACSEAHSVFAEQGMDRLINRLGEKEFFISDVVYDKQGSKTLVAVSRIEADGDLLGYALMEINLDFYKNIQQRAELWSDSTFYLLDGEQQIISAGTPYENRDNFVTTPEERVDFYIKYNQLDTENRSQGSFRYKIDGKEYITHYSNINDTNWRIMLSVNMDHYQAERIVYFLLAFFLILISIILAVWISGFVSKRIMQPIQQISDMLTSIQHTQNYTLRMQVARDDELGELTAEINKLIDFIETENLYAVQQQRLLQQKAAQDALTKVLNKEHISQYLEESLAIHQAEGSPMAVLFVDVDDFKAFNDNYGHIVGDQVLLFLTSLLSKETAGTVGRMGGDEFLVVIDAPEMVQALETCLEHVLALAATKFVLRESGTFLPISCSIGAVRVDFSTAFADITAEQLLHKADAAMYQVKHNHKQGYLILDDF